MRLMVLRDATGWGGGGGGEGRWLFLLLRPDACTRRHQSSAARETESREVLTRHVETEWHAAVETINNRRLV